LLREKQKAAQKAQRDEAAAKRRLTEAQTLLREAEEAHEGEQLARSEAESAQLEFLLAREDAEAANLELSFVEQEEQEDEGEDEAEDEGEEMATAENVGTRPKTTKEDGRADAVAAAAALAGNGDPAREEREREFRSIAHASQIQALGTYNGNTDVELFVIQVNRGIAMYGWSDLITSQIVQTVLKGEAATWLRSLIKTATDDMRIQYWSDEYSNRRGQERPHSGLKHYLLSRFREEINGRGAIEAITNLKQGSTESVDEFRDRVVIAMDKKNYRASEEEKNTEAYRQQLKDDTYTWYAAGLQEDIRMAALGGVEPPQDLESLVITARNAERERQRSKKPKFVAELATDGAGAAVQDGRDQRAADVTQHHQGSADSMQLEELRAEIEALRRSYGPIVCWLCNEKGHISRDCARRDRRGGRGGENRSYLTRGRGSYGRGAGYGGRGAGNYGNRNSGRARGRGRVFLRRARTGDKSKRLFEMVVDDGEEDEEEVYELELSQEDYDQFYESSNASDQWPPN
jgi:hypothetical protein